MSTVFMSLLNLTTRRLAGFGDGIVGPQRRIAMACAAQRSTVTLNKRGIGYATRPPRHGTVTPWLA